MLRDERFDLRQDLRVPAELELAVDAVLERAPAQRLEPGYLRLRRPEIRNVCERLPAPQREGFREQGGCFLHPSARMSGVRVVEQPFEAVRVERVRSHAKHVTGRLRHEDRWFAVAGPGVQDPS